MNGRIFWLCAALAFSTAGCEKSDQKDAAASGQDGKSAASGTAAFYEALCGDTGANQEGPVVMKVGKREFHAGEIADRINAFPPSVRATFAAFERRKEFVEGLVKDEVLRQEACAKGFHKNASMIERAKGDLAQAAITEAFEKKNQDSLVSDADARKYYEENNAEFNQPEALRVAHIFRKADHADARASAAAKARLQAVAGQLAARFRDLPFIEKTVRDLSEDEGTKSSNGDLNYFTAAQLTEKFGEDFVKAASALNTLGEWTKQPVKGKDGWHLIRFIGRRPAVSQTFEDSKDRIRKMLYFKKREPAIKEWIDGLKKKTSASLDESLFDPIRAAIPQGKVTPTAAAEPERPMTLCGEPVQSAGKTLYKVGRFTITDQDMIQRFTGMSPYVRANYARPDAVKEYIHSMMQLEVLAQEGCALGLHVNPEFIRRMQADLVYRFTYDEFERRNTKDLVSDDDARKYYNDNVKDYQKDETVRISHIFRSVNAADPKSGEAVREGMKRLHALILKNKSNNAFFGAMSDDYNEDQESKPYKGDLRYYTKQELTEKSGAAVAEAAFSLNKDGELYKEPVRGDKGWHLIVYRGRTPPVKKEFEDVKDSIKSRLFYQKRNDMQKAWLDGLRDKAGVTINDEALKGVKLNHDQDALVKELKESGAPGKIMKATPITKEEADRIIRENEARKQQPK
ncbi:MAG: Foldase protein PrsA [Myxococcota bacterium]|nr:Foldase protein PrsA [Myxococcota bacterium]